MDKILTRWIDRTAERLQQPETASAAADYRGFRRRAEEMTDLLLDVLSPRHAAGDLPVREALAQAVERLEECLAAVLPSPRQPEQVIRTLLDRLPEVRRLLLTDLEAAYAGDPAAHSPDEIVLCYPGFTAIGIYRLAHVLYGENVPLLPRIMTEYAHWLTGIDIHPGARIGDHFFIDHGTGVVIGETTTIGEHVKLYQHVTLGAKSFELGADGNPVKGIKRHPDIGDRVVIYAGATILGGRTRIGNDCVIGGNVWLTHSVEAGKMVLTRAAVTDEHLTRDIMEESPLDSAQL